ncbi:hypothetical protein MHM88_11290 [Epibacterium sp. MM17-32]|uniref:hypothetical protein n=1 Tax=Epibacterium sp. MM17-32 TaxID=2917734 RepID=UPI001EF5E448|nr:hypothetical protein [Epibacterium sp. MM17-32]MCG7628392.1 hypothetical protein [Epibacterium sp. MM17-32]
MFRPTIPEDIMKFAPTVREADKREVQSISGLSVLEALSVGLFHSSDCMTGIGKSGGIVTIAGVVRHGDRGAVWMISSPEISKNKRELLTEGHKWLGAMQRKYGDLTNVVDARNTLHQRLIRHLGFELGDQIENYGVEQIPVIPFKRKQNHV